jgi:hypothetical protein
MSSVAGAEDAPRGRTAGSRWGRCGPGTGALREVFTKLMILGLVMLSAFVLRLIFTLPQLVNH